MGKLLKHNDPEAKEIVKNLTPSRLPRQKRKQEISIEVAIQFLHHDTTEAWDWVWPLIKRRGEWGNEVIRRIATRRLGIQTSALKEKEAANLYLLLSERFPHREDPQTESGFVGEREQIARFRDGILKRLVSRGTWAAAQELERLDSELPSIDLTRQINFAKEEARQSTWRPTSPEDLLDLLKREENRQIRNADQLLEVIKESLERLQRRLYGEVPAEVPAVADVWNEVKENQALHISTEILVDQEENRAADRLRAIMGRGNRKSCYIPKEEERLSDYVQRHVARDIQEAAIVINREVQVQQGQEADIYIAAENLKTGEKSAAVVEVKGCWNSKLESKMKTQLKERYLHQAHAKHGLYLIGWFLCPKWHSSDYRKGRTRKMSVEEAREHFDQKASSMTDSASHISSFVLDATWQGN